ncbi:MAG: MarR family transcriptional regulator [Bacilli bacterium]|jgi:DNA-binding MarR family transcriptional regulator|nr:MarR family transcriptional regulator [Bacilli bacterium]
MLENEILKNINSLSDISNKLLKENNIILSGQEGVLQILNEENGLEQYQIAEILDIKPSSLSELLKKLEDKEEIKREEGLNSRSKIVFITKKGQDRITNKINQNKDINLLFENINDEEKERLLESTNKLVQNNLTYLNIDNNKQYDQLEHIRKLKQEFNDVFEDIEDIDYLSRNDLRKLFFNNFARFKKMRKDLSKEELQEMHQYFHNDFREHLRKAHNKNK